MNVSNITVLPSGGAVPLINVTVLPGPGNVIIPTTNVTQLPTGRPTVPEEAPNFANIPGLPNVTNVTRPSGVVPANVTATLPSTIP